MSSGKLRSKHDLTRALMEKEMVPEEEKKAKLESSLFEITRRQSFLGSTLQCLNISYTHMLPTLGIMFNSDLKRWDMWINPHYFCKKLDSGAKRQAVLIHEILHILHKHPLRVAFTAMPDKKRQLMNVAMDMAINQLIKDLPDGCPQCPPPEHRGLIPCLNELCPGRCIFVADYFDIDKHGQKVPWKHDQTAEHYYEKLIQRLDDPDQNDNEGDDNQQGQGQGQGKGGKGQGQGQGQGKGQGNAGGGAQSKDIPDTHDVHHWDSNSDEVDQLEATQDLIKRAMIKTNYDHTKLPDFVKDTLEYIEARKAELDYKRLIMLAMKSSLPANYRVHSWTRKSRRFGNKAPGTTNGKVPKLDIYIDTSGSISVEEANEFLSIVDEFLRVGAHECRLNMFHTQNYYSEPYKLGDRLDRGKIQSGGTDLAESLRKVAQHRPDLAVFLTDGCYSDVDTEKMVGANQKFPTCLFIISRHSHSAEHPLKRLGHTIKIPNNAR